MVYLIVGSSSCNSYRKYTTSTLLYSNIANLCNSKYVNAAFTQSTWQKHSAALRSFENFAASEKIPVQWPIQDVDINKYCEWALSRKNLQHTTVSAYLKSLASLHKLQGLCADSCNNYIAKTILRGAENLSLYSCSTKLHRNVMTLELLKILGHEISVSNWSTDSKQVIWSACVLAFFGSFRMGELLSTTEKSFDQCTSLTWSDITFYEDNAVLIHVKSPKSRNQGGDYVDIFTFTGHNCCPVKTLLCLKEMSKYSKDVSSPVFRFESGKLLTKALFNTTVRSLLARQIGIFNKNISGHSFRAGIPSALAKYPSIANSSDIMGWGRWSSPAYKKYTRLPVNKKKQTFSLICSVLNKQI